MSQKAQSGLEYLMTYGWALVIIASVVGVLVFVINPTSATASFSSSDPSKIMLKGSSITENTAGLVLQNITGGKITINSITFSGDIGDTLTGYTLNRQTIDPATDFPLELTAGSEILLENLSIQKNGENSSIFIEYTDATGLDRKTEIKSGNGGPPDPVTAYFFEEVSGNQTPDSSGNKYTGSVAGTPVLEEADCKIGKCMKFNGSTDYVNLGQKMESSLVGSLTIMFWAKPNMDTSRRNPLCKSYGGEFCLTMEPSGQLSYYHGSAGTNTSPYMGFSTSSMFEDGVWVHVTVTRELDSLSDTRVIKSYKNGDFVKQGSWTSDTDPSVSIQDLQIAKGYTSTFNGIIDEVKLFNRALSAEEIQAEYNRGK